MIYEGKRLVMGEDFRGTDRAFGAVARFDKKGSRKSTLILISSMLAFFILILYLAYDFLFVTPDAALDDKVCCSGLTIVLSIAMIFLFMTFLENAQPDEVYLYRHSIRHYRGRRLVSEMVLDHSVSAHVSIDKDRYPPIRAVRFTDEHAIIDIDSLDGYNAFDIVTAWDSILEIVRSNEVQTTEGFEKYAGIRENTLPPPPGNPLKDLPPLTKEQTLKESVEIIEAEEHETGRAKELVKGMLEEGKDPVRSIWSRESKYRWVLTFLKAQILAVLIIGA
ncbi:MAG: hypothetical protein GWN97_02050, partial [Thermoplasmata archaeon]|nr:hypothetical protein [Thermoplasmata archaeon]